MISNGDAFVGWLCLLLMVQKSASYDFVVGGQKGWSVPNDPSFNPFNQWAEKSRFQVGDSRVIVLAERNKNNIQSTNASPLSSQSSSSSPPPSTGQEGQSPTSDTNQTPSPVSEPPPPNVIASACLFCWLFLAYVRFFFGFGVAWGSRKQYMSFL
ncbi:uncharacterized protein HKW66_Vig0248670 [Vigna angularis]|uniref:Phytocyanin domain-containing protein n=1 Tax=Phaseolus angularis TaxID=3914 RepID=A0A8T0JS83_PHAAN|nr:uncharacterized protein HKW66_Vig0248670 [Vigna angularis]